MNPSDIHVETRSRLAPLRREELSPERQADFDALARPGATNLAGMNGPGGIWLRLPTLRRTMGEMNRLLRSDCGLDPRLTEAAILAVAREMDSQLEWAMHEPVALANGVSNETVEIIRRRHELTGVPQDEAVLIQLAREAVGRHRVESVTYAKGLALFGEEKLLGYAALIACYAMTAIMLTVVDQQLPEGRQPGL